MAPLPVTAPTDPTLDAINAAIENVNNLQKPRPYLGMSGVGEECERRLWLQFRWCMPAGGGFDAKSLCNFEDGHRTEDLMAARLRMVPGVELYTVDPASGEQFGFSDLGGHFRGHIDGAMRGILQAPKAWHVWEHKASEKGPAELAKAKAKFGEKEALKAWHPTYYAQALLYMHYAAIERHYLTCSSPGGRLPITSVRTNANEAEALALIAKAERIIFSAEPPPRCSEDPAFWKCKTCPAREFCHGMRLPAPNFRNCLHATPEREGDGRWTDARTGQDVGIEAQRQPCKGHLYIPKLLERWGEAVDSSYEAGADPTDPVQWVMYQAPDGFTFKNGTQRAPGCYESSELAAATPEQIRDPAWNALRDAFGGRFVEPMERAA